MVERLVQLHAFFKEVGWTTIDDCEDYILMIKAHSPELSSFIGYIYERRQAKLVTINLYDKNSQYALAA